MSPQARRQGPGVRTTTLFPDLPQLGRRSQFVGGASARRSRQHEAVRIGSHASDVRITPESMFQELDEEFGFSVDVAADAGNAKCERFYDEQANGLTQDWTGEVVWMNPPYSNIEPWTKKAADGSASIVVGLLPVRTDLLWFHRDVLDAGAEVRFIRGRVRFEGIGARANAPFPSMLVIWGRCTQVFGLHRCIHRYGHFGNCAVPPVPKEPKRKAATSGPHETTDDRGEA